MIAPTRSVILETGARVVFHTVLLLGVYLLFAGHNQPGGGFIGGLVTGAAFVLRYAAGGIAEVQRAVRVPAGTLLGAGVVVAIATGAASWLAGGQFLESGLLDIDVPLLGSVKASSTLPFDIGVFLVVVGLVLALLHTLGAEPGEEDAP